MTAGNSRELQEIVKSDLVKSVIAASIFYDIEDVLAKYVTETTEVLISGKIIVIIPKLLSRQF